MTYPCLQLSRNLMWGPSDSTAKCWMPICATAKAFFKFNVLGRSQDGGGVGQGEHFLPHKFIKRAFKRRANSTKQLLNASRGHQSPRKATQLFERREKKYSSIHQNIDTSFPNQETLQATCTNPHTARKRHNKENSTNCQNTERTPQTQQFKQDEETEE